MDVDGNTGTADMKKSLDGQYLNIDFIRSAAVVAQYKGMSREVALNWKEENITNLIFLIFRDYIFTDNGKPVVDKMMEVYEKAVEYGDVKCFVKAQSYWMIRFMQQQNR